MKQFKLVFSYLLLFSLSLQHPLYAIQALNEQTLNESAQLEKIIVDHFNLIKTFTQEELEKSILLIYNKALAMELGEESLPAELRTCAISLINNNDVTYQECLSGIHSYIDWISKAINKQIQIQSSAQDDAFPIILHDDLIKDYTTIFENGINRSSNKCNCAVLALLNQILHLVVQIQTSTGNTPFDPPCNTLSGILGDSCTILGGSISQALLQIENCCQATLTSVQSLETLSTLSGIVNELNDTVTTLNAISIELNATLTTITALSIVLEATSTTLTEIQNTLTTCCNNTTTQIADLKATITTDFQSTWTILSSLTNCCNGTFTVLTDIKSTITTDFQDTWTILGDVGVILGKGATISGTLLNIMSEINTLTACCNGTFTSLTDIRATITTDFQNTWTILGDVGVILGRGATISGTLLNIMNEVNTLTACCAGTFTAIAADFQNTWTILGDVGVALGRGATISGTLSNLVQDANGNFTVLGNVGTILGAGATISGTLLSIFNNLAATTNNSTLTTLGDVGVILGRGATISGTLLNIMSEVNTLTACCAGTFTSIADLKSTITTDFQDTWTILGNVGVILGRGATISGTLLNIMSEINTLTACCNSTLTSLGDVGVNLGKGATISGTLLNIMNEINTLTVCCNTTLTTIQADFNNTWTILACLSDAIFSITTLANPGSYCLANDITFTTGNAITISSSDVSLNLNNKTINGSNAGSNGIVINTGLNNITVQNGTIRSVTTDGVQTNSGASNITLNALKILSTGNTGMNFLGAAPITNCLVTNCEIVNTVTGIYLKDCNNNTFKNCIISTVTPVGVRLVGGQNNIFDSCIVETFSTLDRTETSTLAGFWIATTEQATKISNCTIASSTVVGLGHPYGILMDELAQTGTLFDFTRTTTGTDVVAAVWSPDGNFLAVASNSTGGVLVYKFLPTSVIPVTLVTTLTNVTAQCLSWSPDGNFLAVGTSSTTSIYQFDGSALLSITSIGFPAFGLSWSPNGFFIASVNNIVSSIGTVRVFSFSGSTLTQLAFMNNASNPLISCEWSPDSNYIIYTTGPQAGVNFGLNVASFNGTTLTVVAGAAAVGAGGAGVAKWSPNGRYVAWLNIHGISIFEFTGSALNLITSDPTLTSNTSDTQGAVSWSRDGNYLIVGSQANGSQQDALFYQFALNPYSLIIYASQFNNTRANVATFNPNAQYACIGGVDGTGVNGYVSFIQTFTFPSNCIIENNQISGIRGQPLFFPPGSARGVGIEGSSANNLFTSNVFFNNDINTQGIAATANNFPNFELVQNSLIINDFQNTWTILGDVGVILGKGATISGTLLNIMNEVNTLTTCCNSSLTTIQADFQDTWTILGDVGVILGKSATISGTLLSIYNLVNEQDCNATYIHNSNVGTTGFIISTSGVYKLAENISFNPATSHSAITITTSNVLLDLQCFTLAQGNSTSNVNGVTVSGAVALNDITIENGLINGFTSTGILGIQINNSAIQNISINNCGLCAVDLEPTCSNIFINNCKMASNSFNANAIAVMQLSSLNYSQISNCTFANNNGTTANTLSMISSFISFGNTYNNIISTGNSASLLTTFSINEAFSNTFVNCSSSFDSVSSIFMGFNFADCTGLTVINANVLGAQSSGSAVGTGILAQLSVGGILKDCKVNTNFAFGGVTTFTGISVSLNNEYIVNNCIVNGNGSNFNTAGISVNSCTSSLLNRCISSVNSSSGGIAQGLIIQGGSNCTIEDCEFSGNAGSSDANSFGINFISATSTNIIFSRCRAINNGISTPLTGNQLFGLPLGSIFNLNSTNLNSATNPWGNIGVIP